MSFVPPAPQTHPLTLNLILHGLFAMQFTKDNIQLVTPYVSQHRYLASSWDPHDLRVLCPDSGNPSVPPHGPLKSFTLQGVKKLPPYDPKKLKRALVLSKSGQKFNVDPDQAYITITLPWPQDIVPLRFAKQDPKTGKQNIFKNPPLNTVTELSLCQALIYPIQNLLKLRLDGTSWKPGKPDPSYNTINLHLWAEPDHRTLPSHAAEAYSQLGKLLSPLNFELESGDVTGERDASTGVNGMSTTEEMGLAEWLKQGEGTEGSNCGLVMVID